MPAEGLILPNCRNINEGKKLRKRLRLFLIIFIAIVPINAFRIMLYRILLGYRIDSKSQIGLFNYIDVDDCEMHGASIGHFNEIRVSTFYMGPGSSVRRYNRMRFANRVFLADQSLIVGGNVIIGTLGDISPYKIHENFFLGTKSIVTSCHIFDLSDSVTIHENVTFAGKGCQVWTHGFDINHVKIQGPISIGRNVYIGSGSIILQGIQIADNVSIGAGTVVSKPITESGFFVSSHLIRKGDIQNLLNHKNIIDYNGTKFIRK